MPKNQQQSVFTSVTLPSGLVLKNRLVKAAMEENLAEADLTPSQVLKNCYNAWAEGGVGLIITGNVMVDHLAMTGPGGLALEHNTDVTPFAELARLGQQNDSKIVMQINHPGRQVFKKMGGKVLSASNVALSMGKHSHLFGQPKAMTHNEIDDVIERFTNTALQAQKAGFDGVQIHAAHGYLLAQFLSPLTNKRDDKYGGSLENRARLLTEITQKIKASCANNFSVSVVLGAVSHGAEVIADGNVHIYGTLRGRAIAGAKGLENAHIFCQKLEAELVSINGNYWISDSLQGEFWGSAVQIQQKNESLEISALVKG